MNIMSLLTRKINLLTYISDLEDEKLLSDVENYILEKQSYTSGSKIKPFTVNEMVNRINESEQDYEKGKFMSQSELEDFSSKW